MKCDIATPGNYLNRLICNNSINEITTALLDDVRPLDILWYSFRFAKTNI